MSDDRLDYAILISLAMREEAEVMASALRAEGIDAFTSALNYNWHLVLAFGGVQVFVPWAKLDEAKAVIRARISDAAANLEGEAVGRRDRWKTWAVIFGTAGLYAFGNWAARQEVQEFTYAPVETLAELPTFFEAPANLTNAEQRAVLRDYCRDNPDNTVISRDAGMGNITPCSDILLMDQVDR